MTEIGVDAVIAAVISDDDFEIALRAAGDSRVFGRFPPQLIRNAAYKLFAEFGVADACTDKNDSAALIAWLEKLQEATSPLSKFPFDLYAKLYSVNVNARRFLKILRYMEYGVGGEIEKPADYRSSFCRFCYRHRDRDSGEYCCYHKPEAGQKKSYQAGVRNHDLFFDNKAEAHNSLLIDAKRLPSGIDMVYGSAFNCASVTHLLESFPLANSVLQDFVKLCFPIITIESLAQVYYGRDENFNELLPGFEAVSREAALNGFRDRFSPTRFEEFAQLCKAAGDINSAELFDSLCTVGLSDLRDLEFYVKFNRYNVLAEIYRKADDPDGFELLKQRESEGNTSFRFLSDLTEFLVRYEAYQVLLTEPARRGPKIKHSPIDILKAIDENPGKSNREIARLLNCSPETVSKTVRKRKI